jgi:hypothetical protein
MRKELVSWPWTYGEFEDGPQAEGYVRGSWDQLVAAVREQLIDQDDYAYVVERAASA